jgi:hypothetical protein
VTILAENLKAAATLNLNSSQRVKSVRIISINGVLVDSGTTLRRLDSSRHLEVAIVEYEVLLEEICSSSSCDNADEVAAALYDKATDSMKAEIDSGKFATSVQQAASSSNVEALLAIAVDSSDFSEVVLEVLGGLSVFYPDWENNSYCKNDGGEPMYMQLSPDIWLTDSKQACCKQYFSFAMAECMGVGTTVLGWYPDWANEGNDAKCHLDDNVPNYMRQDPSSWIYPDVDSCCERYYNYAQDECIIASGGTAPVAVSKWYPAWAKEGNDSKCIFGADAPSYMKIQAAIWLYDDASACCERYYGYAMNTCLVASGGSPSAIAMAKWYVKWDTETCVKNCEDSSDLSCGGLAESWDELFDDPDTCCKKKLSHVARKNCTP